MPIVMPEEKPRQLAPAGAHTAVCNYVVDLGTQETSFGPRRQVYIGWELPDEHMANGRPFTIGRRYTYSSNHRAALRADVEGWLGRPLTGTDFGRLDLGEFLGRTCTLGIRHETNGDRTYANIMSVMRPPKGIPERVPLTNPGIQLSLDESSFDISAFEGLPNWLKEPVSKSREYDAAVKSRQRDPAPQRLEVVPGSGRVTAAELNDEIPF